jgi:hypothetical protein
MPEISFCITCCNRLWQIQQTFETNLANLDADLELVLVDFGSRDGLAEWVWSGFKPEIDSGKVRFYEVCNPVNWSSPRAKNLSHRLATGRYLFNLDADNFLTAEDILTIRRAASSGSPCHQWTGTFGDGSFGRIGLSGQLFRQIGGYDESFLPMGAQDLDLLNRLNAGGNPVIALGPPTRAAIQNQVSDKIAQSVKKHGDARKQFEEMNLLNLSLSRFKLAHHGSDRSGGFGTYLGYLNGRLTVVDGLGYVGPPPPGYPMTENIEQRSITQCP